MEVIGTIGVVAGTISATVKLVKVIHEKLGKVQPSATDEIQATHEVVQGQYDEGSGDMDGLEDSDDVNFQFLQNLHYHYGYPQRPPTTATPPIPVYTNTGTFTATPPCYDLSNASPYDDIVEPSPHYTFAAAAASSSFNSNASSEDYTNDTESISDDTTTYYKPRFDYRYLD